MVWQTVKLTIVPLEREEKILGWVEATKGQANTLFEHRE